jgi:ariadne-1
MYKASCGHQFCKDCWKHYLTTKIKDDGVANIKCPAHNCAFQMDDGIIQSLIEDRAVKQIHQKLITNSFVEVYKILPPK